MNGLPEGARGRALALALLGLVLAALWLALAAPLIEWYGDRADLMERQGALASRMGQIVAELPALRGRAAAAADASPMTTLDGGSDAVAGAALQQRLQQMAASVGASLSSTEVLPGVQRGAYRRIGVRIGVNAPYPAVIHLLGAIADASPRLLIDDLQLQGARGTGPDADPPVSASMVVFGFRSGQSS